MTSARSLAAAQTIPVRGDVEANLERHLRLVRVASEAQARLLVFPELSLTGYELDLAAELAFSEKDPRLAPLVDAASEGSITLVVGAPLRLGERLHIGAFIIAPDGSLDVYTKHHLGAFSASASADGVIPPAERTVFSPGDRNPLLRLGGHTAAVAVCADTGRPSHPHAAAERGADTYLASMFVIPSDYEQDAANLGAYAVRHALAVVLSNFGGPSGGLASAGRSTIWSEQGERLARLEASGSGVVVAVETEAGWRGSSIMLGGT
jgi:predicted amidohydrolase